MKQLALFLALLLLVACGGTPATQPATNPDEGTVADAPQVRTAPAASYSQELQGLLDKITKVKSYTFYYIDHGTQLQADQWFVKGSKAVVKLYQANYWNRDEWVDVAYLDMDAKTAVGYCENWQQVRCTDNNRPFSLVYAPFERKLPTYWIAQIPTSAQVVGSETIDQRFVTKVQWVDSGVTYTLWMDNTFGLPLKATIEGASDGDQMYYYKDMAFNAVKDEMLTHTVVKRG